MMVCQSKNRRIPPMMATGIIDWTQKYVKRVPVILDSIPAGLQQPSKYNPHTPVILITKKDSPRRQNPRQKI